VPDEQKKKPPEKTFEVGRMSMFTYEPDLDDVEEILNGRIDPRIGDAVKLPTEAKND
jgi:hypothetical protein